MALPAPPAPSADLSTSFLSSSTARHRCPRLGYPSYRSGHTQGLSCRAHRDTSSAPTNDKTTLGRGSPVEAGAARTRRDAICAAAALLILPVGGGDALAISAARRAMREQQIKEEDFKTMDNGLKYYDVKVGGGRLAEPGDRVTVHYVVKWKGVTFMTSRQGAGVTGGTPYGFDVGASERGMVLKALDLGVQGMRVGGQREFIVPPELGYGKKGIQEIPPNATLEMNIELLSIKESPFGYQVKLVEG